MSEVKCEDCGWTFECIGCGKTQEVSAVASNDRLDAHALKKQLDSLLIAVNSVTSFHNNGKVPEHILDELSNRQIDVEEALREMGK